MSMSETGFQLKGSQTHMTMPAETREAMMTVETVRYFLRSFAFDEDDVVASVSSGDLVAWNIGTVIGLDKRRELRVWGPSAEHYLATGGSRPRKWNWTEVLASFFPPSDKPWITGLELQHAFNCGANHITRLIETRDLALVPGTSFQPGPNGSPTIRRESVLQFLADRLEVMTPIEARSFFTRGEK